jgi:hypothetical protein
MFQRCLLPPSSVRRRRIPDDSHLNASQTARITERIGRMTSSSFRRSRCCWWEKQEVKVPRQTSKLKQEIEIIFQDRVTSSAFLFYRSTCLLDRKPHDPFHYLSVWTTHSWNNCYIMTWGNCVPVALWQEVTAAAHCRPKLARNFRSKFTERQALWQRMDHTACPGASHFVDVQWTQNNCELRWPLQVDTWEGGEDRKAIAYEGREPNPFLVLYDVKQLGSDCRSSATENSCE